MNSQPVPYVYIQKNKNSIIKKVYVSNLIDHKLLKSDGLCNCQEVHEDCLKKILLPNSEMFNYIFHSSIIVCMEIKTYDEVIQLPSSNFRQVVLFERLYNYKPELIDSFTPIIFRKILENLNTKLHEQEMFFQLYRASDLKFKPTLEAPGKKISINKPEIVEIPQLEEKEKKSDLETLNVFENINNGDFLNYDKLDFDFDIDYNELTNFDELVKEFEEESRRVKTEKEKEEQNPLLASPIAGPSKNVFVGKRIYEDFDSGDPFGNEGLNSCEEEKRIKLEDPRLEKDEDINSIYFGIKSELIDLPEDIMGEIEKFLLEYDF